MPELPGPPDDYDDDQRAAWLEGAATVARLQAQQWAIVADRYAEEADDQDDEADACDDCGADLVDAMGGAICPNDACPPAEDTNA